MFSVCGYQGKGFQHKDLAQLHAIPVTPRGTRSDRWQGLNHGDTVDGIYKVLHELFDVVPMNPQFLLSPNEACLIGGFELGARTKTKKGGFRTEAIEPFPGAGISVAVIHANDSSRSLRILGGARVFLCSNGMVVTENEAKRKHTSGLRLHDWLTDTLGDFLPTLTNSLQEKVAPLHEGIVTPRMHDDALLALGRQGIMPWSDLPAVDNLWQEASSGKSIGWVSEENADAWDFKGTKFDWFGALSFAMKQLPVQQQLKSLRTGMDLITAL